MSIGSGPNAWIISVAQTRAFQMQGTLWRVLATGKETGGVVGALDERCAHGLAAPMHVHEREDEIFYVVHGRITFFADDKPLEADAGTFVYLPRYIRHGFRVDSDEARVFNFVTPAGFERLILDHGAPAAFDELARPSDVTAGAPPADLLRAYREKYGMIVDAAPHAH